MIKINPKALEVAREFRGYTAKELCEFLGIQKSQYSKIENGGSGISEYLLNKLCNVLDLPKEFFFRSINLYHPNLHYRKKANVTAKIIGRAEASMNIFRADLELLLKSVTLENINLPIERLNELTPADAAYQLRQYWNVPKGPISDLVGLIEDNGVIVIPVDFYSEEIDGRSMTTDRGQNLIFLNKNLPGDRLRFTAAHELGHILLHLYKIIDSDIDTEREANRFASCFLVPPDELKAQLTGQKVNLDTLLQLKRYWKVSIQALIQACLHAGIINKSQHGSLRTMISARRIRKVEPEPIAQEMPTLLRQITDQYIEEISGDKDTFSKLFSLGDTDFEQRYYPKTEKKLTIVRY